jgi:hypothetical protein
MVFIILPLFELGLKSAPPMRQAVDSKRVSMILRLCRAMVRPVSVFSMSRSASSGRKASVAPQVGTTR